MELMQRDETCCRCEDNGNAEQAPSFIIKPESPCDVVTNERHTGESSILHGHENHRVTENGEERGKEKDYRLDMVTEQRDIFDRDIETPVNQLPDRLHIIGEVEAPILEIRPAGAG